VNAGTERWDCREWELVAELRQHTRPDRFHFPTILPHRGEAGGWWSFDPGESIYVFTGRGVDRFCADPPDGRRPQFHFYWNRDAMAWTTSGERIFLREADGSAATEPFVVP
jgi:hypothetical protein